MTVSMSRVSAKWLSGWWMTVPDSPGAMRTNGTWLPLSPSSKTTPVPPVGPGVDYRYPAPEEGVGLPERPVVGVVYEVGCDQADVGQGGGPQV
jgi:hypothetical protein